MADIKKPGKAKRGQPVGFRVDAEDPEIARVTRNMERETKVARSRPGNDHPRSPRQTR